MSLQDRAAEPEIQPLIEQLLQDVEQTPGQAIRVLKHDYDARQKLAAWGRRPGPDTSPGILFRTLYDKNALGVGLPDCEWYALKAAEGSSFDTGDAGWTLWRLDEGSPWSAALPISRGVCLIVVFPGPEANKTVYELQNRFGLDMVINEAQDQCSAEILVRSLSWTEWQAAEEVRLGQSGS